MKNVKNVLEDVVKVWGFDGLAAASWFIGSTIAPEIREEFKFFPFMEMTGVTGSGKTTLLCLLWKIMGRDDYEGICPKNCTMVGFHRVLKLSENDPVVLLDDYRDPKYDSKYDMDIVKNAYNGHLRRISGGTKGEVVETNYTCSFMFCQEEMINCSDAMRSRIVSVNLIRNKRPVAEDLCRDLNKLRAVDFLSFRNELEFGKEKIYKLFCEKYDQVKQVWEARSEPSRKLNNYAMVVACGQALAEFIECDYRYSGKLDDWMYMRSVTTQEVANDNK